MEVQVFCPTATIFTRMQGMLNSARLDELLSKQVPTLTPCVWSLIIALSLDPVPFACKDAALNSAAIQRAFWSILKWNPSWGAASATEVTPPSAGDPTKLHASPSTPPPKKKNKKHLGFSTSRWPRPQPRNKQSHSSLWLQRNPSVSNISEQSFIWLQIASMCLEAEQTGEVKPFPRTQQEIVMILAEFLFRGF